MFESLSLMTLLSAVLPSESKEVREGTESGPPIMAKAWKFALGAAAQLLPTHLGEQVSILALVPLSSFLPRWSLRVFFSKSSASLHEITKI
jgi:hypothetical protein